VNRTHSATDDRLALDVQRSIDEVERHGRRILEIAGIAGEAPSPE
jgi:hypothetical protein